MNKCPNTVQQWIESLPNPPNSPKICTTSPLRNNRFLPREYSFQSDDGSNCSSVESVLELRKPDPEAVLLGLGFGSSKKNTLISRIPPRFLQPSKLLPHIDINKWLEQYDDGKTINHASPLSQSRAQTQPKAT